MNPIPPGVVPQAPIALDGHLEILTLVVLAALFLALGLMVWRLWVTNREYVRLFCPTRLRRVLVVFRRASDGTRIDVVGCSVFGHGPITCGKVCLHGTWPGAAA